MKNIIKYNGDYFNILKYAGTMRKVTDVSKLHSLGWSHKLEIEDGIKRIFEWYMNK